MPGLDSPFGEEIFPNIQPKTPLAQLEVVSSHPVGARPVTADRHLGCPAEDSALGRHVPRRDSFSPCRVIGWGVGVLFAWLFFSH